MSFLLLPPSKPKPPWMPRARSSSRLRTLSCTPQLHRTLRGEGSFQTLLWSLLKLPWSCRAGGFPALLPCLHRSAEVTCSKEGLCPAPLLASRGAVGEGRQHRSWKSKRDVGRLVQSECRWKPLGCVFTAAETLQESFYCSDFTGGVSCLLPMCQVVLLL